MKSIINHSSTKIYITLLVFMGLIASCDKETNVRDGLREVTFKATASKLTVTQGESIIYRDSSLNVASRLWKFEGGSIASSDEETVSVTYPEASVNETGEVSNGFFTELEISHPDGSVESNGFNVKVYPTIEPDFEASTTVAVFGSTIDFLDKTIAARSEFEEGKSEDTILWEFEGGIPATSTERNPSVSYPEVGKYSVKLTVFRSEPESMGTTTKEGYIDILLTPPCDNSVNLLGCNNFGGESESLSEWEVTDNSGQDNSVNLSISTDRFSEGAASIKYAFDEGANPAFTNNILRFVNAPFTVTEAGSYTLSLDVFADIMSSGTEYVFEISTPMVGTTDDGPTKLFFRTTGGAWFAASSTNDLAPGDYYVQIKMWNTPWHVDMKFDMFLDNISVVRN